MPTGSGWKRICKVAAHYFEKAARMGHGPSQRNLGIMSGMGDGIEKDIPSAYAWLRIATVNKDPVAPESLERSSSRHVCPANR